MDYLERVTELENEGLTTSDAQGVADVEEMREAAGMYSATYSPDDNKLRISCSRRLDPETFARIKAAGYKWAPKQGIFVAPKWTPGREDLAMELAGEIGDEDTTLAERAEVRAERFEEYSEKRNKEGDRTLAQVDGIAGAIPFGQPIMVGHHSERKARKDAERIQNGMSRAVKLWETSKYWEQRAAGALHHAKYKELPAVRARRIKKLEAEKRGQERALAASEKGLAAWTDENLTLERARVIAGGSCGLYVYRHPTNGCHYSAYDALRPDGERYEACPSFTLEQVQEIARRVYPKSIVRTKRWLAHYDNRLTYEKAMLNEQGRSDLIAPKARPKQLPLVNYKQESFTLPCRWRKGEVETFSQVELTSAQYMAINADQRGTREVEGSHRIRIARVEFNDDGTMKRWPSYKAPTFAVFLTDSKTHKKPEAVEPTPPEPPKPRPEYKPAPPCEVQAKINGVQTSLDLGVKVAVAPELFVTPVELADRVIEEAKIKAGDRVLEPSAGTGRLLGAMGNSVTRVAVEINRTLADGLRRDFMGVDVHCNDFLDWHDTQGFDRIVMNPPFAGQADIAHVRHAFSMLKPGGRLVAIMSAGVEFRQDRKASEFRALVEAQGGVIEALPADSFKQSGTGVNTVLVTIDK